MASQATGNTGPAIQRGWRRAMRSENLPFAIAIQGLGLFVLAFFLGAPATTERLDGDITGWAGFNDSPTVREASDTQVPADLLPEQIRLPRFPDIKHRAPRQEPAPRTNDEQEASSPGLSLAALRVDSVRYDAPEAVQIALALPDAPERLTPGTISTAKFGEGSASSGRQRGGEGGWGGIGVTAGGRGSGACGRGGPNSSIIIERSVSLPITN